MTFTASCGDKALDIIDAAAKREAAAKSIDALPDYPAECRVKLDSGVKLGEPLSHTALRLKNRLDRQNQRIEDCAVWFEDLKSERLKTSE